MMGGWLQSICHVCHVAESIFLIFIRVSVHPSLFRQNNYTNRTANPQTRIALLGTYALTFILVPAHLPVYLPPAHLPPARTLPLIRTHTARRLPDPPTGAGAMRSRERAGASATVQVRVRLCRCRGECNSRATVPVRAYMYGTMTGMRSSTRYMSNTIPPSPQYLCERV